MWKKIGLFLLPAIVDKDSAGLDGAAGLPASLPSLLAIAFTAAALARDSAPLGIVAAALAALPILSRAITAWSSNDGK